MAQGEALGRLRQPVKKPGKVSMEKGYQGFLAFDAKTKLIKHDQKFLYATHFRGPGMFIETNAALRLISQYFES